MKCEKCNNEHDGTYGSGRFCSISCSHSRTRSDEVKRKISESVKKNPTGFVLDKTKGYIPLPAELITLVCAECNNPFTIRKSNSKTRKYCGVECANKNKYNPNSVKKHRSIYNGYQMDSGAELAFAKLLDSHSIKWEKNNTKYFNFEYPSGKQGKYYPDFYLPDYNHWVEIKGKYYLREDDKIRWKAVGKNHEVIFADKIVLPSCI